MKNVFPIFSSQMKMAELVSANPDLLVVLTRMGISLGFGEETVEQVCDRNGVDADTFILLSNVYTFPDFKLSNEQLCQGHVVDVVKYLNKSHQYYTQTAIARLKSDIKEVTAPCDAKLQKVIWKFFDDYTCELGKHFNHEENEVLPYVRDLLFGKRIPGFSIEQFDDDDAEIDEKLSDLISIVMKSLPAECDASGRKELLQFLFALKKDLDAHSRVEDSLLVPITLFMEKPRAFKPEPKQESEPAEELSEREKEILVCVAKGMINKEIADMHNISIHTVISHRKNITRKTGIKTVAGLTVYALLNGMIDINSVE